MRKTRSDCTVGSFEKKTWIAKKVEDSLQLLMAILLRRYGILDCVG